MLRAALAILAATAMTTAAATAADADAAAQRPAFEIVWNGPSAGCSNPHAPAGTALPLAKYGVSVNANQSFSGAVITIFYSIGKFPILKGAMNATACWSKHVPGCSYNPWGEINATQNGGVPQAADIASHLAALVPQVEAEVPDAEFDGLLIVDWEAWRPLASENDDGLSL